MLSCFLIDKSKNKLLKDRKPGYAKKLFCIKAIIIYMFKLHNENLIKKANVPKT